MFLDVLIKNGKVFDGTGNPWFRTDIGVEDGEIKSIGDLKRVSAITTISLWLQNMLRTNWYIRRS